MEWTQAHILENFGKVKTQFFKKTNKSEETWQRRSRNKERSPENIS